MVANGIQTSFMVSIGKDKENVLEYWNEELLEKCAGGLWICVGNVVDQFDAHI